jgi:hypothetical protein
LSAKSCRALDCQFLRIRIAIVYYRCKLPSLRCRSSSLGLCSVSCWTVISRSPVEAMVVQSTLLVVFAQILVSRWERYFCVSNIHYCPSYILFVQNVGRRASPCDADTGPTVYAADWGAVLRKMQSKGLTVSSLHRARGPYS